MGRIHLGTIFGTPISIDFSFILLIAFWVFFQLDQEGMPVALLWAPILLISVLFHELAHAAAFGMFGYGSSEIVLGGFGGVTMNRGRIKNWHDILISGAGPLASFVLAVLSFVAVVSIVFLQRDPFFHALMPRLIEANVWWGIFNLMPVGPLDGAHMWRSFLRLFLRDQTAYPISIWTSFLVGGGAAIWYALQRDFFIAIFFVWLLRVSWEQWQFFRKYNRTDL